MILLQHRTFLFSLVCLPVVEATSTLEKSNCMSVASLIDFCIAWCGRSDRLAFLFRFSRNKILFLSKKHGKKKRYIEMFLVLFRL